MLLAAADETNPFHRTVRIPYTGPRDLSDRVLFFMPEGCRLLSWILNLIARKPHFLFVVDVSGEIIAPNPEPPAGWDFRAFLRADDRRNEQPGTSSA